MDDQAVLRAAIDLIESEFVGVMTTVDKHGSPHARLMGAAVESEVEGVPNRLYSLSGHDTRKIENLRNNKRVCWLFHSRDDGKIVQLCGEAHVQPSSQIPESAWEKLSDTARPYAEQSVRDEPHFSFDVIESRIDQVELLGRDFDLLRPQIVTL